MEPDVFELFELPEWESRLPIHQLYVAVELFDWVSAKMELHSSQLAQGGRTLFEHLEQTFSDFRCSVRPPAGDLRRMMPNSHGVWKMHSVGLRVYGWFPAQRTFAAVTAALEKDTKTNKKLNDEKLLEVRNFIKLHNLGQSVVRGDILAIFPI